MGGKVVWLKQHLWDVMSIKTIGILIIMLRGGWLQQCLRYFVSFDC